MKPDRPLLVWVALFLKESHTGHLSVERPLGSAAGLGGVVSSVHCSVPLFILGNTVKTREKAVASGRGGGTLDDIGKGT